MFLTAVAWIGLGLIFGSFTNVLILRHGTSRDLGGRSACMKCGKTLQWFELVPVLSWIALRGKCHSCGSLISLQYPLVEILTATGFWAMGSAPIPLVAKIIGCLIIILLIAIAVYDLRHMLMPDPWVFGFAALALLLSCYLLFLGGVPWTEYILLFFAGPLVALPLWLLWFFSGGTWMGFGDVKFAVGMGWLLGMPYGFIALMYSFIIGAIVGLAILLPYGRFVRILHNLGITRFQGRGVGFTMKSEVPFGPFLIIGTCIIWISLLYSFEPILDLLAALVLSSSW